VGEEEMRQETWSEKTMKGEEEGGETKRGQQI